MLHDLLQEGKREAGGQEISWKAMAFIVLFKAEYVFCLPLYVQSLPILIFPGLSLVWHLLTYLDLILCVSFSQPVSCRSEFMAASRVLLLLLPL